MGSRGRLAATVATLTCALCAVAPASGQAATAISESPPDPSTSTTATSGPSGTVATSAAHFEFTSSEAGSTFTCSPDGAAARPCTSPLDVTGVADGSHRISIAATDPAGNTDPTPAERTWTVATGAG